MVKICENQVHQLPRTPLNSADPRWITAAIPTIPSYRNWIRHRKRWLVAIDRLQFCDDTRGIDILP